VTSLDQGSRRKVLVWQAVLRKTAEEKASETEETKKKKASPFSSGFIKPAFLVNPSSNRIIKMNEKVATLGYTRQQLVNQDRMMPSLSIKFLILVVNLIAPYLKVENMIKGETEKQEVIQYKNGELKIYKIKFNKIEDEGVAATNILCILEEENS